MLFLASTSQYTLGDKPNGPLAVAHLLIPLEKHLGTPSTVVSKKQALYDALVQLDFPVQDGEVALTLISAQDSVQVDGSEDDFCKMLNLSARGFCVEWMAAVTVLVKC